MPLHVKSEDVPQREVVRTGDQGQGSMIVKRAHGNECSLMIATRAPGYHTTPHAHESDQINCVLKGEIWFFVEEKAFHCREGDFQRIPANKIHWAWNRSDREATVVEAHAPALIGGSAREGAVSLFDVAEQPNVRNPSANKFLPFDSASVERKYFPS